jgi:hypothetical protein
VSRQGVAICISKTKIHLMDDDTVLFLFYVASYVLIELAG